VQTPFYFNSAEHLLRIGPERAATLGELLESMQKCPEDSIFQHTFRTLQEHHFSHESYSNNFADWIIRAFKESELAERLAGVDVRQFGSIQDLRNRLVDILGKYLDQNPGVRKRLASEPFYFCASSTVVVPSTLVARNLGEFVEALKQCSARTVHYHFIDSRLRLKLDSNDFSVWLEEELGLKRVAELINRIDIYTSTLAGVRNRILHIVETELS